MFTDMLAKALTAASRIAKGFMTFVGYVVLLNVLILLALLMIAIA